MFAFRIYFLFFVLLSWTPAASAESRAWKLTQVVGDHQDSTSTVIISDSGLIQFESRFSNGHRTDGDHFVAEFVGYTADGSAVISGSQGAGVNATFGGATRVITVKKSISVEPEKVAGIEKLIARHYQMDTKGEIGFFINFDEEGWSLKPIFDPVTTVTPPGFLAMARIPVPTKSDGIAPYSIHRDCIKATGSICP